MTRYKGVYRFGVPHQHVPLIRKLLKAVIGIRPDMFVVTR